jgi:hypothetical protein
MAAPTLRLLVRDVVHEQFGEHVAVRRLAAPKAPSYTHREREREMHTLGHTRTHRCARVALMWAWSQVVALALHDRGPQTLAAAAAATGLKLKQTQQALFVLVVHTLVRARPAPAPARAGSHAAAAATRASILYTLDAAAVRLRLLYPRFVTLARLLYGPAVRTPPPPPPARPLHTCART